MSDSGKEPLKRVSRPGVRKKHLSFAFVLVLFVAGGWKFFLEPRIDSIEPVISERGGLLTLRGRNFGYVQLGSRVIVDGMLPTKASYWLWTHDTIILRLPRSFDSGGIVVRTMFGASRPAMVITESFVPYLSSK